MKTRYTLFRALTCLAGLAALSLPAGGRQLTPSEALSRVKTGALSTTKRLAAGADAEPMLAVSPTSDPSFTSLYVFADAGEGFMVVSADDAAVPLLG